MRIANVDIVNNTIIQAIKTKEDCNIARFDL